MPLRPSARKVNFVSAPLNLLCGGELFNRSLVVLRTLVGIGQSLGFGPCSKLVGSWLGACTRCLGLPFRDDRCHGNVFGASIFHDFLCLLDPVRTVTVNRQQAPSLGHVTFVSFGLVFGNPEANQGSSYSTHAAAYTNTGKCSRDRSSSYERAKTW